MDEDGFIHYKEYDPFTSALTKMIVDVDTTKTTDFQNKPWGWTTPAGGGAHLITTYGVDVIGRTIQIATQTFSTSVENTYIVYNDASRETRSYPGWTGTVPTRPTQIRRQDRPHSYFETPATSHAPTVN